MRGHKLSTTRQLNKHWQSGIIGEVIPDLGELHLDIGNANITIHKNNGFDISIGHFNNYIALPLDFEFNAYGFKFKVRDIIPLIQNYDYQITKSFYFDYGYELLLIKHGTSVFTTLDIHTNDKILPNEWNIKIPYNYFKIDKTNVTYINATTSLQVLSGVEFYDVNSGILNLNVEKNNITHLSGDNFILGINGEINLLNDYYYTFMTDFFRAYSYETTDIFNNEKYKYFYFKKQITDNKFKSTYIYLKPNYTVDLSIYKPAEPLNYSNPNTVICMNATGGKRPYYDFIDYPINFDNNETYYVSPAMFKNIEQKDYKITTSEGIYKLESINPYVQ